MALKFTVESFLNLVRQSRLVDADRLEQLVATLPAGGDSQSVADALVAAEALTEWQADKLLKGKHKGFFLGKYRLQSLLGKGGMSSVYLAEHVLMRRRCAIKVLPHKKVNDTSYLERFHREAQAVASLDHPNIVRAYDVDREVDGTTEIHFLVMEYVEGHSLQDLIVDDGPRSYRDTADFIRQSAHGLSHAHEAGLVHRDIKPANLLVDLEGVVKILDLGLARFFEETDENPITLRHDEKVLGTADYLAPEQALDSHQVDARADIYSLGCTMYFLLTGRPPFNEGTLAQRLMWHQTKSPPEISETRADVPERLAEIVSTMMAKDADNRFQTARDVAEHLTAWIGDGDGEPVAQPPVAAAVPVAAPVEPPAPAPPVVDPSPPVATPVESPPPEAGETTRVSASETEKGVAGTDDPGLADFLSQLGNDETPASSAVDEPPSPALSPDVPPTATPVEAPPAPSPPPVAPVGVAPGSDSAEEAPLATASASSGFPELDVSSPQDAPRRSTRSRKNTGRRRASGKGPKMWLAIGGVALLVIIAVVVMSNIGGGDGEADNGGATADPGSDGTGGDAGGTAAKVTPPPTKKTGVGKKAAKAKKTLQVGGVDADFKTIAAALEYVREHKDGYAKRSRRIQVTINVLGGQTYAESIEIDGKKQEWPTGIAIISTGVEPAIIAPSGRKPGIRLNQVEYVRIEGFRVEAKGKPTAVVLSGAQDRVQLDNLVIDGFTESGIDFQGAAGEPSQDALRLVDLRLTAGGAEAVGMKLSEGVYDTSHVEITGCRLVGPQRAGIQLTDTATYVSVHRTVIQSAGVALLFSGENRTWRHLKIHNNTFSKVRRGLVFENMPTDNSDNVTIRRNLFHEIEGPECLVENGYEDLQFSQMVSTANSISRNWSTRPTQADLKKGERELMLPGLKQQRGVKVEFSSTDPAASDFLEPRTGTLPRRGPGNPKNPEFIGAQPFRERR